MDIMELTLKINIGTMKTGKHMQTRFNDDDKAKLLQLEPDNKELFLSLLRGQIKHCFNDISFRDKVNVNVLIAQNRLSVLSYVKKVRGCFATYVFKVA